VIVGSRQSELILGSHADLASPARDLDPQIATWDACREVDAHAFAEIRCRMVLDGCKWDPQVGDVATLAPFPVVIPGAVARTLGRLAEQLASEALGAEPAVLQDHRSLRMLGLPRTVRHVLGDSSGLTPAAVRVIRFDFHPTAEGWRISEANADVPGGYTESSLLPRLMAEYFPGTRPAGDPACELAEAISSAIAGRGLVGLATATGYMEDQQVVAYLERHLVERSCAALRVHPSQITWSGGFAYVPARTGTPRRLDAIVRFYQGEWLANLPLHQGWHHFFRGGRTKVCNPGTALLVESKRFPLVWDQTNLNLPTWRRLLPQTEDPRAGCGRKRRGWVLKTAFCNTGDAVAFSDVPDRLRWRRATWSARLNPGAWVAQRRFRTLPIPTPRGPMFPCLGVFTINGRASGIFGRLSHTPLIDFAATEVAVLLDDGRPRRVGETHQILSPAAEPAVMVDDTRSG
jgi:hypothetical protein